MGRRLLSSPSQAHRFLYYPTMSYEDFKLPQEEEEYLLDEITGARSKKPVMSALNKTKLSRKEMDDLFNMTEE